MSAGDRGPSARLATTRESNVGTQEYTAIGQADADLTSAQMGLADALRRKDLTAVQRRDFTAALRWTQRAARAVARHVDYGDEGGRTDG